MDIGYFIYLDGPSFVLILSGFEKSVQIPCQ